MARYSRRRGVARPARSSGRARVGYSRASGSRGRVGRVASRRRSSARGNGTTVRVVIQQAPAPVVSNGAVSMQGLKKARF